MSILPLAWLGPATHTGGMSTPIPWSRHDGRLGPPQRWRLALWAVATRLARRPRRRAEALDDQRALASLAPPAGTLAESAWRHAQALPPWLLQHSLRTFAWGRLLALRDGLAHDAPVLFASCLLHDLGLTAAAATPAQACFAVRGAQVAERLLRADGATAEAAHRVASAIALHLDPRVEADAHGAEAHLLQAGAALDVVGTRARELAPALRARVLTAHPRLQLKRELCTCLRAVAHEAPKTRVALYVNRFRFLELIERAPFEE